MGERLSARLGDADWLDGAFGAGDLMMVSVLLRLRASGILDGYKNLAAYVARGEARPAYERVFDAQLALPGALHRQAIDRLIARDAIYGSVRSASRAPAAQRLRRPGPRRAVAARAVR